MTTSCGPRRTLPRHPEGTFSSRRFIWIFLLVPVFLLPASTDADDCTPLRFDSMMVKGPSKDYKPGDTVEYDCRPGFKRVHPSVLMSSTCQASGTWTPVLQEACTKKSCPRLGELLNGQVSGDFLYGSTAHFSCNDGYLLIGDNILYCELSGDGVAWSNDAPSCEKIKCQPPAQIPNGSTNSHKEIYEYNEVVTYTCDPSGGPDKYSLVGESKLVCSGPDKWSSDPPECRVIICPYPSVRNGKLVSGHSRKYYYKAEVQFGCEDGFDLQGNRTVVCEADNTWKPELPQCIRVPAPPSTKPPLTSTSVPAPSSTKPPLTGTSGPVVPSATPPVTAPAPPSGELGAGTIAAIVVSVLAVVLIAGGVVLYHHKKKKGKAEHTATYSSYRDTASAAAEWTR